MSSSSATSIEGTYLRSDRESRLSCCSCTATTNDRQPCGHSKTMNARSKTSLVTKFDSEIKHDPAFKIFVSFREQYQQPSVIYNIALPVLRVRLGSGQPIRLHAARSTIRHVRSSEHCATCRIINLGTAIRQYHFEQSRSDDSEEVSAASAVRSPSPIDRTEVTEDVPKTLSEHIFTLLGPAVGMLAA